MKKPNCVDHEPTEAQVESKEALYTLLTAKCLVCGITLRVEIKDADWTPDEDGGGS